MKNIIVKISVIAILIVLINLIFSNYSQATIGNIFSDADKFLQKGESISTAINETNLQNTSNFMYKLLLAIGIVVMFIVGIILGIQFMTAGLEDKAKIKEALVPYIVGCCVIFGGFTIWEITVKIGQEIATTEEADLPEGYKKCRECGTSYNPDTDARCTNVTCKALLGFTCKRCGKDRPENERNIYHEEKCLLCDGKVKCPYCNTWLNEGYSQGTHDNGKGGVCAHYTKTCSRCEKTGIPIGQFSCDNCYGISFEK